jgi:hypothetical protein
MKTLRFCDTDCLIRSTPTNGKGVGYRLDLVSQQGETIARVTIVLLDFTPPPGFIAVRDYSENRGLLEVLMDAGIVNRPLFWQPADHVNVPICRLNSRVMMDYLFTHEKQIA